MKFNEYHRKLMKGYSAVFSKRLAKRMKELEWTNKDLKEAGGFPYPLIHFWLRKEQMPCVVHLVMLAKTLKSTVGYLLGEHEESGSNKRLPK